jgi:hypothetical protein|eukprot:COSAG06_NODE_441_length_15740_cov_6.214144_15_plen_93_part_00
MVEDDQGDEDDDDDDDDDDDEPEPEPDFEDSDPCEVLLKVNRKILGVFLKAALSHLIGQDLSKSKMRMCTQCCNRSFGLANAVSIRNATRAH